MTEQDIHTLWEIDVTTRAFEWFAAHGHEYADLVEVVVDHYLASAESVPA